jgi:nitrogen fixation protein NifU and related proteins
MDADSLYQERLLEHFRQPRHRRAPTPDERVVDGRNPACGDHILLAGTRLGEQVRELHYEAQGCALSIASASMMAEACAGREVPEIQRLLQQVEACLAEAPGTPVSLVGDLAALSSLRRYPMRSKCALLPWRALADWLVTPPA